MRRILAVVAALATVAGACGGGSDDEGDTGAAGDGTRTVEITMRDIAYDPTELTVRKGEEVRFVFVNDGKLVHDAFLGDEAAQDEHEKEMREADAAGGEGGHGHDDMAAAGGISVDPGKRGELTHRFDSAGELFIGCHEPGHYPQMRITVTVA
jgi:uncharacterized cupredoxin-like copper-binding protein